MSVEVESETGVVESTAGEEESVAESATGVGDAVAIAVLLALAAVACAGSSHGSGRGEAVARRARALVRRMVLRCIVIFVSFSFFCDRFVEIEFDFVVMNAMTS